MDIDKPRRPGPEMQNQFMPELRAEGYIALSHLELEPAG